MEDGMENVPIQAKFKFQDIVRVEFEVRNLVQEIRQCDGPMTILNELNTKMKIRMNSLKLKLEKLEQFAKEQDKDTDADDIMKRIEKHKNEIVSLQSSIRKANLACKARIDQNERESLFFGQASSLRSRTYNKENLATTASNITEELMSIAKNMESQVKQGKQDLQVLAESSATVTDTQEEYKGLTGVIQTSKNLLNKYNRREVTDRLLVMCGLILFAATVLYIIKKRVW